MKTLKLTALAATLALGISAPAFAGEGSPDLALPYGTSTQSDPADRPAAPAYSATQDRSFGYTERDVSGSDVYGSDRDVNSGAAVQQRNFEDESGINGQ